MNDLLKDADLCVKCGLCLPYCPTYTKTGNENESPRGRIALIQGWASGQLQASGKLLAHIDHCLLCRSCERVCPAEVPYGRLVDRFRERTHSARSFALSTALIQAMTRHKSVSRWLQSALGFYQDKGIRKTMRALGLPKLLRLNEMDRMLPNSNNHALLSQHFFAAVGKCQGTVALFTGCLGLLLDSETVHAAVRCLTAAGFNVSVPDRQVCCGALAQHEGDAKTAEKLAKSNNQAFADPELRAIVSLASGCGSQLMEYRNTEFSDKVIDISQFLVQSGSHFAGRLKPLTDRVCLHSPCSLKNVMREDQGALQLLQQIPGLKLTELPEQIRCCGAAGAYLLEHPVMAKALADDTLALALSTGARYLATSNIGCALHLAAALRDRGSAMEVIHPVALLARQLGNDGKFLM